MACEDPYGSSDPSFIYCDVARKKDAAVMIPDMKFIRTQRIRYRWAEAEGQDETTRRMKYGIRPDTTMEDQIAEAAAQNPFMTYAVLMNNEWIARGDMGWWGISIDDIGDTWSASFDRIWNTIPDDAILAVVDCHI